VADAAGGRRHDSLGAGAGEPSGWNPLIYFFPKRDILRAHPIVEIMHPAEHFYVVSLQTQEHTDLAYIGCTPGQDSKSVWFISKKPSEAHDFGSLALAREFRRQLKEGEANGMKNDGHVWHVRDSV
jgi:hypothetical protein